MRQENEDQMSESTAEKFVYFGRTVEVWNILEPNHPYPWRFAITDAFKGRLMYAGVPNQCESKQSALRRAWWRCKWLSDGTYANRYKPMVKP
jgi:hypothetical protein